ncbi:rRNA maturation RNase YbeY [Ancylobacter terrae]|uniref:rRNA maturation RNase YbeY n=1 Tax=Ancylobacter sp. sgz301288 TaxID=3342077 RepID=UPI00385C0938
MSPDSTVTVDVLVEADGWSVLPDAAGLVEAAVRTACVAATDDLPSGADIAVMLTDDAAVRTLNREWRGKDKATNVLSFPADPDLAPDAGEAHLGDIAIAFETLCREAEAEGKTRGHHLSHLAVHGTLHLLGFDHETGEDAEEMEALERRILASLGVPDPYLDTELVEQHP